jgi:hypothetical protein
MKEVQTKRAQNKRSKLAAFYDCPEEEFDQVIQENPTFNFRDIIQHLKINGIKNHTGENFKKMRQQFKKMFCFVGKQEDNFED